MAICNHMPCNCEVPEGRDYCSDYCEQEPQTGMESKLYSCRCGHEACGTKLDPAVST